MPKIVLYQVGASVIRKSTAANVSVSANRIQKGNATSLTRSGCPVRHVPRNAQIPADAPSSLGSMARVSDRAMAASAVPIQTVKNARPGSPSSAPICRKKLCAFSDP